MPILSELFPNRRIIPIQLDAAVVRASLPLAWDTLDAIVFDSGDAMDPRRMGDFLAAGVTVLVLGETAPRDDWPWQRITDGWIIRPDLLGPDTALAGEDAYRPTHGWARGENVETRYTIVVAAVLFSILLLASLLLSRPVHAVGGVIIISLLGTVLSIVWMSIRPPLRQMSGLIDVIHPAYVQRDHWKYFTSRPATRSTQPLSAMTRPMLVDARHAEAAKLRIHWGRAGDALQWHFQFEVSDESMIAFVSRRVSPRQPTERPERLVQAPAPADDPFLPLVRRLYLRDGWHIEGQLNRHHLVLTRP